MALRSGDFTGGLLPNNHPVFGRHIRLTCVPVSHSRQRSILLTALSEYNSKGSGVLNDGGGGSYRKLAGSIGVLLVWAWSFSSADTNRTSATVTSMRASWNSHTSSPIEGNVSYAGSDGQPLQGGGLRNKGFATVDVAPAGANVAMGPNGSYAFANAPTRQAAVPTQAPSMAQGFVPGYGQQQGAAPDPMAGMTAAQRLQYAREVEAAQTNARGNQIAEGMRGPKHLRDWNDLRSPVGIAKRNLEFDMKNDPINRSLSGSSRGGGGGGGGGNTLAQQAYAQLSAIQFKGDGVTDFDRQKYADGRARQQQMDGWNMNKEAAQQGMDVQKYQDGAPQRALDTQTAQIMNEAINPNTQPERRAELLKTLNEANGKGGVQIKAIDLPDQLAPDGNTKMKGGQVLVAIHPDGRVQQPARNSQAAPKAGEVQGGYRFKGGDPSKQASWEKA